jgi:hypothetical protein
LSGSHHKAPGSAGGYLLTIPAPTIEAQVGHQLEHK